MVAGSIFERQCTSVKTAKVIVEWFQVLYKNFLNVLLRIEAEFVAITPPLILATLAHHHQRGMVSETKATPEPHPKGLANKGWL